MDTSKIKAFLVKPVYKKIKVWHILVALLIIGAVTGDDKKRESGSSDYSGSDCIICKYYELNSIGMRDANKMKMEKMTWSECKNLEGANIGKCD